MINIQQNKQSIGQKLTSAGFLSIKKSTQDL